MKFSVVTREVSSSAIRYGNRPRGKQQYNAWRSVCLPGSAVGFILLLLACGGNARGNDWHMSQQQSGPMNPQYFGSVAHQQAGPVHQQQAAPLHQHQAGPFHQHQPGPFHQHQAGPGHPHQHPGAGHPQPTGQRWEPGPQAFGHHQSHPFQPDFCAPELCAPVPCRPSGIYGGFEFLWMRAHFDQNVAMIIDPLPGNTSVPFDYNFDFTPRTWIGWQGPNGGGFRATYWRFDDRAATESATAEDGGIPIFLFVEGAGGNLTRNAFADELGDTFTSTHQLKLEALDLELTERFQLSSLQVLAGAGLRMARMDQNMRAEVFAAEGFMEEAVANDLRFRGVGPTVSMQLRRPIGASRFSIYSGMRGSLLIGNARQRIFEMKGAGDSIVADVADHRKVISVGELALGLEYSRPVGTHSQWFIRSGYEVQTWLDAGGPVDSNSTVSLDGITLATGFLY